MSTSRMILTSLLFLALALAILTNPANRLERWWPSSFYEGQSHMDPGLRILRAAEQKTRRMGNATNYLLFSLQAVGYAGLNIHFLGHSWFCNYFDPSPDVAELCGLLGSSYFSHGQSLWWDSNDIVYSVYRTFCWLLILSALVSLASGAPRWYTSTRLEPFVDTILFSIWRTRPVNILADLFYVQVAIYPALCQLYDMIPLLNSQDWILSVVHASGDRDWIFVSHVLVFLFLAGLANAISTRVCNSSAANRPTCLTIVAANGFTPLVAACFAYSHRMVLADSVHYHWSTMMRRIPVFRRASDYIFMDDPSTSPAATMYWITLVLLVTMVVQRYLLRRDASVSSTTPWFPSLLAWMLGGCFGSVWASYQLDTMTWYNASRGVASSLMKTMMGLQ